MDASTVTPATDRVRARATSRLLAWIAPVCALAFGALALLVWEGATRHLDLAVTRALQAHATERWDLLANADTVVGQAVTTSVFALGLAIALLLRGERALAIAPLFLFATVAIEYAFKLLLTHPSPGPEFVRAFMNPLGIRVAAPSAFPSGHVARVTFLAVLLPGIFPGTIARAAALAFVAITVLARIYIGDHWLSDAIGGVLLGTGTGCVALLAQRWLARWVGSKVDSNPGSSTDGQRRPS